MTSIITPTKPNPLYYVNIHQLPDGTWASDQMPLDDLQYVPPGAGDVKHAMTILGLRSFTAQSPTEYAAGQISKYAPPDVQRNALYVLSTQTSGTAWTNAKATMDWVTAMNTYRDNEIARIRTLNFTQLTTYVCPGGVGTWPDPPANLVTPSITSLSPSTGSHIGGTSVVITGSSFGTVTAVKFGANNATTYTVNSLTQITATTPAGTAGVVDVTVTAAGGTTAIVPADRFTYT